MKKLVIALVAVFGFVAGAQAAGAGISRSQVALALDALRAEDEPEQGDLGLGVQ